MQCRQRLTNNGKRLVPGDVQVQVQAARCSGTVPQASKELLRIRMSEDWAQIQSVIQEVMQCAVSRAKEEEVYAYLILSGETVALTNVLELSDINTADNLFKVEIVLT